MITFRAPGQPHGTTILHGGELDKLQYHMNRLASIAQQMGYQRVLLPVQRTDFRLRDSYMSFVSDMMGMAHEPSPKMLWWVQPVRALFMEEWVMGTWSVRSYLDEELVKEHVERVVKRLCGTSDVTDRVYVEWLQKHPEGFPIRLNEDRSDTPYHSYLGYVRTQGDLSRHEVMLELSLTRMVKYRTEALMQDDKNTQALHDLMRGPEAVIPPVVGDPFIASMQSAMSAAADLPSDRVREDMIHDAGRGSLINQGGFVAHTGIGSVPWSVPRKDDPNNNWPNYPPCEDHSSGTAALGSMH